MLVLLSLSFMLMATAAIFLIFTLSFPDKSPLQKRMEHYLAAGTGVDGRIDTETRRFLLIEKIRKRVQKKVLTKEKNNKLEIKLAQSGLPIKPEEFILFQWIITALCSGIFYLITQQWFFLLPGGIAGFLCPNWYLRRRQKKRILKFNEGLADMVTTIIGSLRAGFSFPQSLKSVVEEASSPIKDEMETVLQEMQYGKSLEDALNDLKERMPSEDLDLMVQAILIQRQVGGNLATVLDKIVETIRDRTKIHRQISTLTAQGRLSGYVIAFLPVILGFILYLMQPSYIGTLFHNLIGIIMLSGGLISGVIGFMMIKKITTIEV